MHSPEAAASQAEKPPTEEMIVTGSRAPRLRSSIPNFTSVLEGEDLDDSISTSLDDALRFVPGLQVTREGARGGRTQIALRGLDPNHVVVLIDGVRLNDPTNPRGGAFDPTTLALLDIERVEIVRGPLSTVYGSDALAGAINIITRRAAPSDAPEMSVRLRGGRFHSGQAIAQARTGVADRFGLSLGAAIDTFRDPNSDGGYDGANLKAKVNTTIPVLEVDVEAFTRIHQGSARSFPESSGGPELATLRTLEDRNVREILFGFSLERDILDIGSIAVRLGHASRREELASPGIDPVLPFNPFADVPPTRSGDEYKRWDLALLTTWDLPKLELAKTALDTRVVVGTDFVWEDGESDTFLDFSGTGAAFMPFPYHDHRRTIGFYGELEESIGRYVTLSGSLRYDATPDERDRFSPAAGIAIDIPGAPLTLFGNYGEGFKRPSFYALGNTLVGDPNLRIEESRGWEVGLRGQVLEGRLRGQLSYFEIEVKNLIDFDDATASLVNQSRLISRGVEFEFAWRPLDWLDFRAGATFNHTNYAGGGPDPENRPRFRGFAEIAFEPASTIELTVRALAVSSVKASSFQTGARVHRLAGYERVDVRAAWKPHHWIDLFIEIENLTNRTPREAVGFESPGITPRAGVTFRL